MLHFATFESHCQPGSWRLIIACPRVDQSNRVFYWTHLGCQILIKIDQPEHSPHPPHLQTWCIRWKDKVRWWKNGFYPDQLLSWVPETKPSRGTASRGTGSPVKQCNGSLWDGRWIIVLLSGALMISVQGRRALLSPLPTVPQWASSGVSHWEHATNTPRQQVARSRGMQNYWRLQRD